MRIFNNRGTNLEMPLGNGQKIAIQPYSVSSDFLPSTNFLVMVASNFGFEDLSLIVNGMTEVNMCASVGTCNGFVVYSVKEAMERMESIKNESLKVKENPANLSTKKKKKAEVKEEEKKTEEVKEESPVKE